MRDRDELVCTVERLVDEVALVGLRCERAGFEPDAQRSVRDEHRGSKLERGLNIEVELDRAEHMPHRDAKSVAAERSLVGDVAGSVYGRSIVGVRHEVELEQRCPRWKNKWT